ncbi:putative recombinase [Bracoviriform inaniti]|uniref:Putative recombinase n=1 Tax=Bracoviriform inaniti TaxID=36344 RepID=Q8UZC5_9VIRU|nr:putative recombinase [Bracoviriform inaniti]CAC82100.3 putative recombinase [Bracoviriform inaniti]
MHIRRERVKNHPKLPKTFNELRNILVNYGPAQTIYQGQVVISKTCSAVIFASNAVLERMNDSQELYVDGTFKCVPKDIGAKQLLIFHMRKMDVGIASVLVLCTNQGTDLYKGIWNFLLERVPRLKENLKFVMMDFERALIKSTKETMPSVVIRGCWFHFTKAISTYWQDLGLKNVPSSSVQDILSLSWVLPLLPKKHFPTAIAFYEKKAEEVEPEYQDKVNKFIAYLKKQWLRIAEIVSLWGSPIRTNNICESFHRWVSKRLGNHPNFYVFIDKLTKVITEIENKWQELQRDGSASGTKCFKQFKIDSYIHNQQIALRNGRIDVDEFLLKMKTRTVKDFIQLKLYSPQNVKDFNLEDRLDPEELADLLGHPQGMEVIDHTTVESSKVMQKKKSTITQDLEVTQEPEVLQEAMAEPVTVPETVEVKPNPVVRKRKPAYLSHNSEILTRKSKQRKLRGRPTKESQQKSYAAGLSSKTTSKRISKNKKSRSLLVLKDEPRYKISPTLKAALKRAEKNKGHYIQRITDNEPRFKFSPSFKKILIKEERSTIQ